MMTKFETFMLSLPFVAAIILCTVLIVKIISQPENVEQREIPSSAYESAVELPEPGVAAPIHDDVLVTDTGVVYCDAVPLTVGQQLQCQTKCEQYGVPYTLLLGLIETESSFREDADSGWAYGLCQIGYIHEDEFAERGLDIYRTFDNIECACSMLGDYLARYNTSEALMAYNCGETGAAGLWNDGIFKTQYSMDVIAASNRWEDRLS